MEKEDRVSTIDCLRGRLLAERVTSQKAKQEADRLENKLIELENLLTVETKSRNMAEKKLNILMKKLESLNRSDIASVLSTMTSSSTKEQDEKTEIPLSKVPAPCVSSLLPENLQHNNSGIQQSG